MKRFIYFLAAATVVVGLSGCGCCGGKKQTVARPVMPVCPAPTCAPTCAPACQNPCDPCGSGQPMTYGYGANYGMTQPGYTVQQPNTGPMMMQSGMVPSY